MHKATNQTPQAIPNSTARTRATNTFPHDHHCFIVGLPETGTYNAIMSVTDKFSRWSMAIPGRDTWTLIQRAHSLVIRLDEGDRGSPQKDHFGSGPQVHRKMWRGIFKHQGVKLKYTIVYHPQSNGQSKRYNR